MGNKRVKSHISCTWLQCATFLTDRPARKFLFTHRPVKHKFGRKHWDLASCQVLLNSVQRFQRKSRKCLNQSEDRAAIFFSDRPEKINLVEDMRILLPVKFPWINQSHDFSGRSEKQDGRPGVWLVETFSTSPLFLSLFHNLQIDISKYYIPKSLFSVPFMGQTFQSNTTFC